MSYILRDFLAEDAVGVNQVALAAFDEYRSSYSDWPAFSKNIGNMAALAEHGEIIVAATPTSLVGAVVYVGPGKPKSTFFDPSWSIIRMLVVKPEFRGFGLGRALTHECIRRAERDGSSCIALHTTSIMKIALAMYQRMGFEFVREAPPIFGVPYDVYGKELISQARP
jgi:ribosomal protein S18 acetylase RimI-like enzyme